MGETGFAVPKLLEWGKAAARASTAERDPEFARELLNQARVGVLAVSAIEVAVPFVAFPAQLLLASSMHLGSRVAQAVGSIVLGLLTWLLSRTRLGQSRPRLLGCASGLGIASLLVITSMFAAIDIPGFEHFIPGQITFVMLVAVAALPLRPLQTLTLCGAIAAMYLSVSCVFVYGNYLIVADWERFQYFFVLVVAILCTGLSALLYLQRHTSYRNHRNALAALEDLARVQSHALVAENSATLGRFAAALSHDLNSPIGALKSAVNTLVVLGARQAHATPEEQARLITVQNDIRHSVLDSANRLQELVNRMQRFTNLDRAEVMPANLNHLLTDVAALIAPEYRERAQLELKLGPLPLLMCRPQQLSALFSNLLSNAFQAVNGDGRVTVASQSVDSRLVVRIEDNGRGMTKDQLARIFDPGFRAAGGRVGTGNWSLFSSRQIVREHGGEIRIESQEGSGTRVEVSLPRDNPRFAQPAV